MQKSQKILLLILFLAIARLALQLLATTNTETVPPRWEIIQRDGVSLALPSTFEDGVPSEEMIRSRLPFGGDVFIFLRGNSVPEEYALQAFDLPLQSQEEWFTLVKVVSVDVPISLFAPSIPNIREGFTVVSREEFQHDLGLAVRIETVAGPNRQPNRQAIYMILSNNRRAWVITYSTPAPEYEIRLPDFDQSARTFRVNG